MKNLIIISLILHSLMSGCVFSDCNIVELSKKDKLWIQPYLQYNQFTLENTHGEKQLFAIMAIDSSLTPCNKIEIGPNQYEKYYIISRTNTEMSAPTGIHNSLHFIVNSKMLKNGYASKQIILYDFKETIFDINSSFIIDSVFCEAFDKKIETYYFDKGEISYQDNIMESIRTVHYSKDYGLIKYSTMKDTFSLTEVN